MAASRPMLQAVPLAQRFLEVHIQHGGLEIHTMDILQRMVKLVTEIGNMLAPFMQIHMLHWPENEPVRRTVKRYTDCLLQGCAFFKKHYEKRRNNAREAEKTLPCLCFAEKPEEGVLYQLVKSWTLTMKELHQPTGNDVRMWQHISNHFDDSCYHEFLKLRESDAEHAVWEALHECFVNFSLAMGEIISIIREADDVVTSLDIDYTEAQEKYSIVIPERHLRRRMSSLAPFTVMYGRMLLAKDALKREAREREARERMEAMQELTTICEASIDAPTSEPKTCIKCLRTPKTSFDGATIAALTSTEAQSVFSKMSPGSGSGTHIKQQAASDSVRATEDTQPVHVSFSFSQVEEALVHKQGDELEKSAGDTSCNLARSRTADEPGKSLQYRREARHVPAALTTSLNDVHRRIRIRDFANGVPLVSPPDEALPSPATLLKRSNAMSSIETSWRHRMVNGALIRFRRPDKGRAKTIDDRSSALEDWLQQPGISELDQARKAAPIRKHTL